MTSLGLLYVLDYIYKAYTRPIYFTQKHMAYEPYLGLVCLSIIEDVQTLQ